MYWLNFVVALLLFRVYTAIESRIYDAKNLRPNVHTYLVKLELNYVSRQPAFCSGSIIEDNWILTSAHCFDDNLKSIQIFWYNGTAEEFEFIQKVNSNAVVKNPRYRWRDGNWTNLNADLALIHTNRIDFHEGLKPIKLGVNPPNLGQSAIIAGFGYTEENEPAPREGAVVITECPVRVRDVLCTIDKVRAGDGDSGGALTSKGRLIGVISASCRNAPFYSPCVTAYSNVYYNVDWIWKVMYHDFAK